MSPKHSQFNPRRQGRHNATRYIAFAVIGLTFGLVIGVTINAIAG